MGHLYVFQLSSLLKLCAPGESSTFSLCARPKALATLLIKSLGKPGKALFIFSSEEFSYVVELSWQQVGKISQILL